MLFRSGDEKAEDCLQLSLTIVANDSNLPRWMHSVLWYGYNVAELIIEEVGLLIGLVYVARTPCPGSLVSLVCGVNQPCNVSNFWGGRVIGVLHCLLNQMGSFIYELWINCRFLSFQRFFQIVRCGCVRL